MEKSIELYNFIATIACPAEVLFWMIGVTFWVWKPPSPLGSPQHPQGSRIFSSGGADQRLQYW
jgi:hypothetical protein